MKFQPTSPSASGPELILLTQKAFFLVWVLYTRITLKGEEEEKHLKHQAAETSPTCSAVWMSVFLPVAAESGYILPQRIPGHPLHVALMVIQDTELLSWTQRYTLTYFVVWCSFASLKHLRGTTDETGNVWIDIYERNQTFVYVPHDCGVVHGPGHHEISIPCPADVIHILYVSPEDKSRNLFVTPKKKKDNTSRSPYSD